jgi:hypothetical protein
LVECLVLGLAEWHVEVVDVLGKVLERNPGLAVIDQTQRVSYPGIERGAIAVSLALTKLNS